MAKRSRLGKLSRRKGKTWERAVAKELRDIFGPPVKRGWQAREGCDAPDIEGVPRQWPECKHHARVNIAAAMRQAEEEYARWLTRTLKGRTATPGDCLWPVVYSKSNNEQPFATMRMGDFLTLLREWWKLERLRPPFDATEAANAMLTGAKPPSKDDLVVPLLTALNCDCRCGGCEKCRLDQRCEREKRCQCRCGGCQRGLALRARP